MFNNSPYKQIPNELIDKYSLNNTIKIINYWKNDTNALIKKIWNDNYINKYKKDLSIENIKNETHTLGHYGYSKAVNNLFTTFEKYNIRNKSVAVIGSTTPWIEAMLLNLNNKVTTVEYNVYETQYPNLNCISFDTFVNNKYNYDVIITYSSVEHSGLGRYGDPLDPDGDIKTMNEIYNNLNDNGILIWGAPVGHDALCWNVHRIYGKKRLPLLFEKFNEIEWINCDKNKILDLPLRKEGGFQPVIVLNKKL